MIHKNIARKVEVAEVCLDLFVIEGQIKLLNQIAKTADEETVLECTYEQGDWLYRVGEIMVNAIRSSVLRRSDMRDIVRYAREQTPTLNNMVEYYVNCRNQFM